MKKIILFTVMATLMIAVAGYSQVPEKLVSKKNHIKFFSSTPAEDIEAHNTTAVGTIKTQTGEVVFSVPMQGFEFDKSLMQKHFNSKKFLNTKEFPRAKLKAEISNLPEVNFGKGGTYKATVEGDLTIKGVTNPIKETGTITVKGNTVEVESKFNVTLADYGIEFVKGKPARNIAKTVEVTINATYE